MVLSVGDLVVLSEGGSWSMSMSGWGRGGLRVCGWVRGKG